MKHFWQNIRSIWFDFQDVYRAAVERAPSPAVFVEIGSWMGQSAAFMAVEIANSGKKIEFHCIDLWSGDASPEAPLVGDFLRRVDGLALFEKHLRDGGVLDLVTVHKGESSATAAAFADESVDFCFVDGGHTYDQCLADIRAWTPKIKPRGVIAGHDYNGGFPGIIYAVQDYFGTDITTMGDCWLHTKPDRPCGLL